MGGDQLQFERLNLIYLEDDAAHVKLGGLYLELGNANGAIREYQAVLAGKPIDVANPWHLLNSHLLQFGGSN